MFAVYKKELKSYFTSVVACLYISITALFSGAFFVLTNIYGMSPYVSNVLFYTFIFMAVSVPILTMRSWSDEYRQKTDQLLLTTPISIGKIVIGKFMAMWTIMMIPVLIWCLYPLIMSQFGTVPMIWSYSAIIGVALYGTAILAIGMFISSITELQVVAAIASIAICLICDLIVLLTNSLSSTEDPILNGVSQLISAIDFNTYVTAFLNGTFYVPGAIYFLSIAVLFIFLTCQVIAQRRWNMKKNRVFNGVLNTGFVAIAVIVCIVVNLIGVRAADTQDWMSADVTGLELYTLTDESKEMLEKVDQKINIYVLQNQESVSEVITRLLDNYKRKNSNINVEYKDTTIYPKFYANYTDTAPNEGSIIVVCESTKKSKVIDYYDLFEMDYDYTSGSYSYSGFDGEGQISSAISYVISENSSTIFAVTGHNETSLDATFQDAIEKLNVNYEEVNLMDYDSLTLNDCSMLLLLAPQVDYTEDEANLVIDYMKNGGKVLMTTAIQNTSPDDYENYYSIADYFAIKVQNGIVVETDDSNWYGYNWIIKGSNVSGYASNLNSYALFIESQAVTIDEKSDNYRDTVTYEEMATTSDKALLNTYYNLNDEDYNSADDDDVTGTFDLLVSASEDATADIENEDGTTTETNEESKLIVIASQYAFTSDASSMNAGANLSMFKNIISGEIEVDSTSVSIAAKELGYADLTISGASSKMSGITVAIVIPVAIMVIGIVVWAKRRRR